MMNYILLAFSVMVSTLQNAIGSHYGKKRLSGTVDSLKFQTMAFVFTLAAFLVIGGKTACPSLFTVLLGVAFGLMLAQGYMFALLAYATGPMAITTLIVACSMLYSTAVGVLFWQESVSVRQAAGIVLMIAALFLETLPAKKTEEVQEGMRKSGKTAMSVRWLRNCMLAFFGSGSVGILQKVHQTSPYTEESRQFLLIGFFVAVLILWILTVCWERKKNGVKASFSWVSVTSLVGGITGLCIAFCNRMNLYLTGRLPSAVYYPLSGGAGILCSTLVAVVVFREKNSRRQNLGLAVGIAAIVLLSG